MKRQQALVPFFPQRAHLGLDSGATLFMVEHVRSLAKHLLTICIANLICFYLG